MRHSEHGYWVYIMASKSRTLYVEMTNSVRRRVFQHKNDLIPGFTTRYRIHRLVLCESYQDAITAIHREKQIKGWRREKKVALIESENPTWEDLAEHWYDDVPTFFGIRRDPKTGKPVEARALFPTDPSLRSR